MDKESQITKLRRRLARKVLGNIPLVPPAPELDPITTDQLEEIDHYFPLSKFFIFGYLRSGTTLLRRLVDLHPEVYCNREAHFLHAQQMLPAFLLCTYLAR